MNSQDLNLLSEGQIFGSDSESQLEVIKKYGTKAAITDLCVLTGSYLCEDTDYNIDEDRSLAGRTGWFWTKSDDWDNNVSTVSNHGGSYYQYRYLRVGAVRPVLQSSVIFSQISPNRVRGYNGTEEDIEKMRFEGGGGTDFNVAIGAFSRRVENKIIFTDGEASMPDMLLDAIWIVFGGKRINPKGGNVIHIDNEKLKRLYNYQMTNELKGRSR